MLAKEKTDKLKEESNKCLEQVKILEKLLVEIPDLEIYTNRWKTEFYKAASVNDKVTDFDTKFSCGCCGDSPYFIEPYLTVNGTKVYSSPVDLSVGEKYDSILVRVDDDWEEVFKKNNINPALIEKVRTHLEVKRGKYQKYISAVNEAYSEDDV